MAMNAMELGEQLKEAGNALLSPPSSTDELLNQLDKIECLLIKVEQEPSRSMQDALVFPMRALISNALLKHSDVDVKVAVASCFSEITRITAPSAPYNDEKMKEIFRLTVEAFEKLPHVSGHCYSKAVAILDTFAKVQSCLVMLDLELDELIVDMFQHFLKIIRCNHPDTVFLAMETIMTLVIEESEDLSLDLLTPLLLSVTKDSQSVSSIARKLGERVVTNCAAKLKPYLKEAVQSLGIPLDEYAPIVFSIIQDKSNVLEDDQVNDSGEHVVNRGLSTDDAYPGELSHGVDNVLSLTKGIDSTLMENAKAITIHSSPKLLERCSLIQHSKGTNAQGNTEIEVKLSKEPEIVQKKRGQQLSSLMNPEEGHNHPWIHRGRKIAKQSHEAHVSVTEPVAIKQRTPAVVGPSASTPRKGLSGGSLPKRSQPRKKEAIVDDPSSLSSPKGEILSAQFGRKAPESDDLGLGSQSKERNNSEPRERKPSRKTGGVKKNVEIKSMTHGCREIKKKHEVKNLLHQSIVVGVKSNDKGSILAQKDNRKQTLMVGAAEDEDITEASDDKKTELSGRDGSQPRKTPKKTVKRTCALMKEVASSEQLVGCKIKVWWPLDRTFYEGVLDSFDPIKNKYRQFLQVLYTDGDEEELNLERERWELIGHDFVLDDDQEIDHPKPDASSDVPHDDKRRVKQRSAREPKHDMSSKRSGAGSATGLHKGTIMQGDNGSTKDKYSHGIKFT